jgi:hypothetical protein
MQNPAAMVHRVTTPIIRGPYDEASCAVWRWMRLLHASMAIASVRCICYLKVWNVWIVFPTVSTIGPRVNCGLFVYGEKCNAVRAV